jgi:ABC-2 type transport system ATP-binding protein
MAIFPAGHSPAIEIRGLAKSYGDLRALEGIDLSIRRGQFFGLLGPNGAGKSTTIHILTGLVTFSEGSVRVLGHDVVRDYRITRRRIGLAPQEFNFDRFFPVREILILQAGYYGIPRREARRRADELLERFGLSSKADDKIWKLSGGMKRRLLIAKAMIHEPDILILDEPTAGVDVELRRRCGSTCGSSTPRARRSCSRPTTWKRPRSCARRWRSSIAGESSRRARPRIWSRPVASATSRSA